MPYKNTTFYTMHISAKVYVMRDTEEHTTFCVVNRRLLMISSTSRNCPTRNTNWRYERSSKTDVMLILLLLQLYAEHRSDKVRSGQGHLRAPVRMSVPRRDRPSSPGIKLAKSGMSTATVTRERAVQTASTLLRSTCDQ